VDVCWWVGWVLVLVVVGGLLVKLCVIGDCWWIFGDFWWIVGEVGGWLVKFECGWLIVGGLLVEAGVVGSWWLWLVVVGVGSWWVCVCIGCWCISIIFFFKIIISTK